LKFQLFLNEITQEMIDVPRLRRAIDGWKITWTKECCVLNFFRNRPDDTIRFPALKGLLMRSEPNGGLIWSPSTNAVYMVDNDAYRVLRDLDSGYSERDAARRSKVTLRSVNTLLGKIDTAFKPGARK